MDAQAHEIKLIHIGRQALGMDDDTYRALLARLGHGKTSSKDLTELERLEVLRHMKNSGFVIRPRPGSAAAKANGWARTPEMTKLRALWWGLADAGAVTRPASHQACDDALDAWAVRQLSTQQPALDALRFASAAQMQALIEALKQWHQRLGLRQPTRAAAGGALPASRVVGTGGR